ncbi:MIZ zinc finger family protein [Aphelenchoides avenae]|nr:MIZ zinc finger family protein [Aphelenchus avenae]
MDNWLSAYDGGYSINPYLLHSAVTATSTAFVTGSFPMPVPNAPVPSTSGAAAAPSDALDVMEYCARRRYKTTEQRIVRMYRGEDDDEIMPTTLMRVSLICPITRKRLVTPARGMLCKHLQCFELQAYVAMNDQSQKWKCGVCRGCAKRERLVVDEYFLKVLEDVDPSVDEVELQEDGSFRAVTAVPENPAVVLPVDIGDTQEDDDDDCLVVGYTPGAAAKPPRLRPKQELRDVVEEQPLGGGPAMAEQARGAAAAEESDDSDIIFVEEVQGNPALPPMALRQQHDITSSSSSSESDDDERPRYDLRRRPKRRQRKPPNQGSASKRVRSRSFVDSDEDESGDSGALYALNDGSEHEMDDGTPEDEEEEANEDGVPQSDDDEESEEGDEASPEQDARSEDDDSDWDIGALLEAKLRQNAKRSAAASLPGRNRRITRSRARSSVENEAPQVAASSGSSVKTAAPPAVTSGSNVKAAALQVAASSGSSVKAAAPPAVTSGSNVKAAALQVAVSSGSSVKAAAPPAGTSGSNVKAAALQAIPREIHAQLSQSFEELIRMGQPAQKVDEPTPAQRLCDFLLGTTTPSPQSADAQAAAGSHSTAAAPSLENAVQLSQDFLATIERMTTERVGRNRSDPASSTASGSSSENGHVDGSGGQVRSGASSSSVAHGGTGHHCVLCDLGVERSVIMEHLRSLEPEEGGSLKPSYSAVGASNQPNFPGRDDPTVLASAALLPTVNGTDVSCDGPPTKKTKHSEGSVRGPTFMLRCTRLGQLPKGPLQKGAPSSVDTVSTTGASLPVSDTNRSVTVAGLREGQSQVSKDLVNEAASDVAASQHMPSQGSSSMEDEAASE